MNTNTIQVQSKSKQTLSTNIIKQNNKHQATITQTIPNRQQHNQRKQ